MTTDNIMNLARMYGGQRINEFNHPARYSAAREAAELELKGAIETAIKEEREKMRIECANVCRSQADLRGASDDHKYMADKCAMEIEAIK